MKTMILAALTALSLGAGITNAYAYTRGFPQTTHQSGAYDNTGHSPAEAGLQGGGG
jgi:hypothetical protein